MSKLKLSWKTVKKSQLKKQLRTKSKIIFNKKIKPKTRMNKISKIPRSINMTTQSNQGTPKVIKKIDLNKLQKYGKK